jgi:hypothetical protein
MKHAYFILNRCQALEIHHADLGEMTIERDAALAEAKVLAEENGKVSIFMHC